MTKSKSPLESQRRRRGVAHNIPHVHVDNLRLLEEQAASLERHVTGKQPKAEFARPIRRRPESVPLVMPQNEAFTLCPVQGVAEFLARRELVQNPQRGWRPCPRSSGTAGKLQRPAAPRRWETAPYFCCSGNHSLAEEIVLPEMEQLEFPLLPGPHPDAGGGRRCVADNGGDFSAADWATGVRFL